MKPPIVSAVLALSVLFAPMAESATFPRAGSGDSRLRYATYDPEAVYELRGEIGRALFIRFAEGEEMERFYSGDSAAWEVVKHQNYIGIKPTAITPDTNLVVITSLDRVYTFDLELGTPLMYGIRFDYPRSEAQAREEARVKTELDAALDPYQQTRKNYQYSGRGANAIAPREIFDSGTHTFLRFAEGMTFPAAFAIGPDGGETLTNGTVRGNWLILPKVGWAWRLRYGSAVLCVRNDHYSPSQQDNPGETANRNVWRMTND